MNALEGRDGDAPVLDGVPDDYGPSRGAEPSRHVRVGLVAAAAGVLVVLLIVVVAVALRWKATVPTGESLAALEEQGGVVLVLVPIPDAGQRVTDDLISRTTQVLRERIDAAGVATAEVVTRGQGEATTITLTLVGVKYTDTVRSLVRQGALDLRPVALEAPGISPTPKASVVSPPLQSGSDSTALRSSFAAADCPSPATGEPGAAQDPTRWLIACTAGGDTKYLLEPATMRGSNIDTVRVLVDAGDTRRVIAVVFDSTGAQALAETSTRLARLSAPANEIAIVLDSVVVTVPVISAPVLNGSVEIDGNFTDAQARELADLLDHGALPFRLKVTEVRTVPAP